MKVRFTRREVLAAPIALPLAVQCRAQAPAPEPTASVLDFVPARHHDAIRAGNTTTDLTVYFGAALAEHDHILVPAGLYPATSIRVDSGKSILTDGVATRFRQLPGAAADESLLLIEGSDVSIGDCTLEGIIRLFRAGGSEFNHGLQVLARRGRAPVRNVRIGNVRGKDLRGDLILIHCQTGATLEGVRIGNVFGQNILRNIVAIVGGRDIDIGGIDGTACGYAALDIEPEGTYSAPVETVHVRSVRGAVCAIQANPDTFARAVRIDRLDTDPRYMPNSTPPFVGRRGQSQHNDASGLVLRNAADVSIGTHRARGHSAHAVFAINDASRRMTGERTLDLGGIDYAEIGRSERTYSALINAGALEFVRVRGGVASVAHDGQSLILGDSERSSTRCLVEGVSIDGLVARYVVRSEFRNIRVVAGAARGAFQNLRTSRIVGSRIEAGYLGYNLTDTVFEQSSFAGIAGGPYLLGGNSTRVRFRDSTVNGARIADEMFSPSLETRLR